MCQYAFKKCQLFVLDLVFNYNMELSLVEHSFLKSNFWWASDPSSDYYIKGGHFKDHIYLMITNLKKVWVSKLNQAQVITQKALYNKLIDIQDKDLMSLLGSKLEKHTKDGIYHIVEKQQSLEFTFKLYLKIYLFNWKFQLLQTKMDVAKLIRKDLIQPLILAVITTQKRLQIIEKNSKQTTKEINDVELWRNSVRKGGSEQMSLNQISSFNRGLIQHFLYNQELLEVSDVNSITNVHHKSSQQDSVIKSKPSSQQQSSSKLVRTQEKDPRSSSSSRQKRKPKKKKLNFL